MSNNNSLSMVESKLPPGFRFHPRDEELICDYLMKKVDQQSEYQQQYPLLIEVDLNKSEPWEIPGTFILITYTESYNFFVDSNLFHSHLLIDHTLLCLYI